MARIKGQYYKKSFIMSIAMQVHVKERSGISAVFVMPSGVTHHLFMPQACPSSMNLSLPLRNSFGLFEP